METRVCSTCKEEKPTTEYYNGAKYWCKSCTRKYWRERYKEPEYKLKRRKQGRGLPSKLKYLKMYQKTHLRTYINNVKPAHSKLNQAINAGVLIRKPCAICGNKKSEGHHEDYEKPLNVIWLCGKHHKQLHVEKRDKELCKLLKVYKPLNK